MHENDMSQNIEQLAKFFPPRISSSISIDIMLCAFENFIIGRTWVGGSWYKSLQLQPLQQCYCENSESQASTCVMRRHHSYHVHAVASRNKWFTKYGASGKLTLWTPFRI